MKSIEINTFFEDKPVRIEISDALGAGADTYYVSMNGYYVGRVWKIQYGWRHDLNPTSGFQGDDVAIIIDLIEEKLMEKKSQTARATTMQACGKPMLCAVKW